MNGGKKIAKSAITTYTPEKQKNEEQLLKRARKKNQQRLMFKFSSKQPKVEKKPSVKYRNHS